MTTQINSSNTPHLPAPVDFHLRCALADLIGAYEACVVDNNAGNHNWEAHKQTIVDLLSNYDFLAEEYSSTQVF